MAVPSGLQRQMGDVVKALAAVVGTVIGVVVWVTARTVRRYENDLADRNAAAAVDAAERIVRVAHSKASHPNQWGNQ